MGAFLTALGALGGVAAAALPSVVSSGISSLADMRNTDKTNQMNKDIANQNLAFQRENLDYQKALQQQIFEREDTAYQRTVEDMRAAGLSPLSMSGTNQAGQAIQTQALNNSFQAERSHAGENFGQSLYEAANFLGTEASRIAERDSIRAQAEKTEAETEAQKIQNKYLDQQLKLANLNAQLSARGLEWDNLDKGTKNKYLDDIYNYQAIQGKQKSVGLSIDNFAKSLNAENSMLKANYNRGFGIVDGMTDKERTAAILLHNIGFSSPMRANNFVRPTESGYPVYESESSIDADYLDSISRALLTAVGVNTVNDFMGALPSGKKAKSGKK